MLTIRNLPFTIKTNNNRGYVTDVIFNSNGLISQQTNPNGQVTRFQYDANLNRVHMIVGLQLPETKRHVLKFGYDEEDQLTSETDAEGGITLYDFDAPGCHKPQHTELLMPTVTRPTMNLTRTIAL